MHKSGKYIESTAVTRAMRAPRPGIIHNLAVSKDSLSARVIFSMKVIAIYSHARSFDPEYVIERQRACGMRFS